VKKGHTDRCTDLRTDRRTAGQPTD